MLALGVGLVGGRIQFLEEVVGVARFARRRALARIDEFGDVPRVIRPSAGNNAPAVSGEISPLSTASANSFDFPSAAPSFFCLPAAPSVVLPFAASHSSIDR